MSALTDKSLSSQEFLGWLPHVCGHVYSYACVRVHVSLCVPVHVDDSGQLQGLFCSLGTTHCLSLGLELAG